MMSITDTLTDTFLQDKFPEAEVTQASEREASAKILLAQQVMIEQMREALIEADKVIQDEYSGTNCDELHICTKAIALQPDLTALREHDAEVVNTFLSAWTNGDIHKFRSLGSFAVDYIERIRKGE